MRRAAACLLAGLAAAAAAGCGGGGDAPSDPPTSSASTASSSSTATATPSNPGAPPGLRQDEQAAADVATRYLEAFTRGDARALCATRTPADRQGFAETAGTCERGFEVVIAERPGVKVLLRDARVGAVRVRGRNAEIDVVQPEQSKPLLTLLGQRVDGEWLLYSEETTSP